MTETYTNLETSKLCVTCGKEYRRHRSYGKEQWRKSKYCSTRCAGVGARREPDMSIFKVCKRCYKKIYKHDDWHSKERWTRRKYCSPQCANGRLGPVKSQKLLSVWRGMKHRCNYRRGLDYRNYGGRGIKVCERWQSYQNFEADMLPTYRNGLTLDRIDVDGHYEPSNCRWATHKEQVNNRRSNRLVTVNGYTATVAEWSRLKRIDPSVIRWRLNHGWEPAKAVCM